MSPLPTVVELRLNDFAVGYRGQLALDCPHLALSGSIIGIIGHNGSGKSTLIKSLLDLLPPWRGTATVYCVGNGTETALTPERDMSFSPEKGAVFEDIPVESYIKLWCRLRHQDGSYYRNQGKRFVERLDLSPLLAKLGRELSKGERQRVQAAVGFLGAPRLFLFDEPFDGLDIRQSADLAGLMREELPNTAIIVSSHRMEVLERLADKLVVLKNGEIFSSGTVPDVCRALSGVSADTAVPNLIDAMSLHLEERQRS